MDKKKILIVCRSFYPLITPRAFRATELAKEFAAQGHEVVVLTPSDPSHAQLAQKYSIVFVDMGKPIWKTPSFGNTKLGYLFTRAIFRLLQLSIEYPDIELMFKVHKKLKKMHGFDLLISIAVPYPVHWGVALVWNRKIEPAMTWVADCGDPYMGEQTDTFRKWFYFKYIEKWFMRKADFISIPIESAREAYYQEFQSKIKIIPQGFKFDKITGVDSPQKNKIPFFAYAGGFIPGKRDPREFLELLTTISLPFKFFVYTKQPELLIPFKTLLNEKLEICNVVPRDELLPLLTKMNFLVNFDNNTGVQLPSKLIDYSLVDRPVLNITNRINKTQIEQFLNGDYSAKLDLGDLSQYRIENVIQKFLILCK